MSLGTHPARLEAELELAEFREKIDSLAFNFRMHTAAAAIANRQLDRLEEWTVARNRNARRLYGALEDLPCLRPPRLPDAESGSRHAFYHVPFLLVPDVLPIDRDLFCKALSAEGVKAEPYVRVPFHLRPRIQNRDWLGRGFPWSLAEVPPEYAEGDCPVAERCATEEWQIKNSLHEDDPGLIDQIAAAIRKVAAGAKDIAQSDR